MHDLEIVVALGKNKSDKNWKNEYLTWGEFIDRLRKVRRTSETMAEYHKMTKSQKAKAKDGPSFVGGFIRGGQRKKENIQSRSLVTLDVDFATDDFLFDLDLVLGGCTYILYTTHSHRKSKPKYRLIIPTEREMLPDEYSAICRKVASMIGMEYFDKTSFDVNRLMYFPSCPKDAKPELIEEQGELLEADTILKKYEDWTDPTQWDRHPSEDERRTSSSKMEDPRSKIGIIGAFCRSYGISEAIETFIPDVYTRTAMEDRWTYHEGSSVGGLVIYDQDTFAFSHHETDPISGREVNAFDLVRIHKFRHLDDKLRKERAVTELPSYQAMVKLAMDDKTVMQEVAAEDFGDLLEEGESLDWAALIDRNPRTTKPNATPANVILLLDNHPKLKGRIKKDLFSRKLIGVAPLPWSPRDQAEGDFFWEDDDSAGLRNFVSQTLGFRSKDIIEDGFTEIYNRNQFHPVKSYLESLVWDGKPRVETVFIDWLGVEDIPDYTRLATKQMLKAMIKRIYEPGCEYQEVVVLVGEQGIYKTNIFRDLSKKMFLDSLDSVESKIVGERTEGVWILCLDELRLFKKLSEDAKKEFISRQAEKYRPAFLKYTATLLREFIIVATTNRLEFLGDFTGDRRYIPLLCGDKDKIMEKRPDLNFKKEVDQILAEAVVLYRKDPSVGIPQTRWKVFDQQREYFRYENEYMDEVKNILAQEDYPDRISVEWIIEKSAEIYDTREDKLKVHDAIQRLKKYKRIMKQAKIHGKNTRNGYQRVKSE